MNYTYAVFGAGRQGTAAAYDMGRWGEAGRIILADRDLDIARHSAERVNQQQALDSEARRRGLNVSQESRV